MKLKFPKTDEPFNPKSIWKIWNINFNESWFNIKLDDRYEYKVEYKYSNLYHALLNW